MKRVVSEGAVRDVALCSSFLIIIYFIANRGSSVGIATWFIAGRPKIRSSLPCGVAGVFRHIGLADSGTLQWASGVLFSVIKRTGREASSAEVNV